MLFTSLVPVMAQSSGGEIDLKLNESVLQKGEEVIITATVKKESKAFANGEVLITVKNEESKNVIYVQQMLTDEEGKISDRFAISNIAASGVYEVVLSAVGTVSVSKFQVVDEKPVGSVSTDKLTYQLGETVNITGKVAVEGNALENRTAIIKVYVKDQLVFVKELLTGDDGTVATSFVTSKNIGTYNIQLSCQGHELTTNFEVTQKEAVDEMAYQIDGSANRSSYNGGETAKVSGIATTTKKGVQVTQDAVEAKLMLKGKLIFTQSVNVSKNGRFSVAFKLANETANYDVILKNKSAEKTIKIIVTAVNNANNGGAITTGGGGVSTGGFSGGGVSQGVTPVPAKATSTVKPAISQGKVASVTVTVKAASVVNERSTVTVSEEDVKTAMASLSKTDASKAELRFELEPSTAKTVELKIPLTEITNSQKQDFSVVVVSNGVSVRVPMQGVKSKSASDMLNVQVAKADIANLNLNKGSEAKDSFNVSATLSTGDKISADTLNLNIALTNYKVDYDKAILVKVNSDGKFVVVGNKVVDGNLEAAVVSGENYVLVERNIEFKDVSAHWSEKFVESMASKGIVSGYENGAFSPEKSVTRAEFVTMLIKSLDLDLVTAGKSFKDISANNWANQYIETAYTNGIVKGTDGKFNPDAKITRAEMAVMIANAMKLSGNSSVKVSKDTPAWATDAISAVMSDGLMAGNDGQFRPNDLANRAESATVIYKVFNQE